MMEEIKDEIKKKKKDMWIEAWFAIEVLAVNEDTTKSALETHIEKLTKAKDVFVYEKKFSEIQSVDKPMKNVEKGFSQVADVKLFVKNLFTLMSVIFLYGPSSIEIIGPKNLEIRIDEVQNLANTLAGVVHQFASAGIGGIIIGPE